ncbi:N-acetylgalactosaminyltransferase 7 [Aureococcus anophagefferens]|nr:N-acetylgalactosaminyltransferase 7 [Aureococcus anophagefferens]
MRCPRAVAKPCVECLAAVIVVAAALGFRRLSCCRGREAAAARDAGDAGAGDEAVARLAAFLDLPASPRTHPASSKLAAPSLLDTPKSALRRQLKKRRREDTSHWDEVVSFDGGRRAARPAETPEDAAARLTVEAVELKRAGKYAAALAKLYEAKREAEPDGPVVEEKAPEACDVWSFQEKAKPRAAPAPTTPRSGGRPRVSTVLSDAEDPDEGHDVVDCPLILSRPHAGEDHEPIDHDLDLDFHEDQATRGLLGANLAASFAEVVGRAGEEGARVQQHADEEAVQAMMDDFAEFDDFEFEQQQEEERTFLQITNNGKKTKDKFTAADKRRVGSTLKAYAELALKDPTKEFPDETKNLDFDTLKGIASSCYHLAPLAGADKAKFADVGYQCSCPQFWHYGKCKHSLGMAIHKGKINIPPRWNITNITEERRRGRPRNANGGGALTGR